MQSYRTILMTTWLIGGSIIILLFIVQTQLGAFSGDEAKAWEWLSPNLFPTLTLVLGVTQLTKPGSAHVSKRRPPLFLPSLLTSILFLASLILSILLQPFTNKKPIEALYQANVWLGPLQGFVSSTLGVFFAREIPKGASNS